MSRRRLRSRFIKGKVEKLHLLPFAPDSAFFFLSFLALTSLRRHGCSAFSSLLFSFLPLRCCKEGEKGELLSVQKSALTAAGRDKLTLLSSSSLLCQLTLDLHCPIFTPMCRWVGQPGKLFNLPPKCWKLGQDCYPFFLKKYRKIGQDGKSSSPSHKFWKMGQGAHV